MVVHSEKKRQLDDEMCRFEAEISGPRMLGTLPPPPPPPCLRPVIGANTYNEVQLQIQQQLHDGPVGPMPLPPPPPPPPLLMSGEASSSPFPTPPPPFIPPQVRQALMQGQSNSSQDSGLPGSSFPNSSGFDTQSSKAPLVRTPVIIAKPPTLSKASPTKSSENEQDDKYAASNSGNVLISLSMKEEKKKKKKKGKNLKDNQKSKTSKTVASTEVGEKVKSSSSKSASAAAEKRKPRKTLRYAGGQVWDDCTLNEWASDDFRIFCGDLGNDVSEELLIRVFSHFPSFLKAKVVRDRRTNKSKGYGFVSFKDPQDYIKAMKEINGKYVGSRPIKLRKSSWKDRSYDIVVKKKREKQIMGLK